MPICRSFVPAFQGVGMTATEVAKGAVRFFGRS
jgi:hypothetical protein